jgi:hypothetical protein
MWVKIYRKLFYIAIMLSMAACGSLEGVGKGLSGAFKGFGKLLP